MIERFYQKIFISIVSSVGGYDTLVSVNKKSKEVTKESRRFEGDTPEQDMAKYLLKQVQDTPFYYVALLNDDTHQGAIEGCSIHDLQEKESDIAAAKTVCRNEQWTLYSSLNGLNGLIDKFDSIGIDFIFSPFSILEQFFADKIEGRLGIYALAQKDAFSIAFFEDGKLEYAHHYSLNKSDTNDVHTSIPNAGFTIGVDEETPDLTLPDLDGLEILEDLSDLSDIQDLDDLDDLSEFSEDELTLEEKHSLHPSKIQEEVQVSNADFERFRLIQKTLNHFYDSPHCHNRFAELICVADAYGSGSDLKRYLEDELFLSVLIRKIDVCEEVMKLARLEEEGL